MHNIVRTVRKNLGLTQEKLAKQVGISRPYLSQVENGAAVPSVAKASTIAKALGSTVDELFGGAQVSQE